MGVADRLLCSLGADKLPGYDTGHSTRRLLWTGQRHWPPDWWYRHWLLRRTADVLFDDAGMSVGSGTIFRRAEGIIINITLAILF